MSSVISKSNTVITANAKLHTYALFVPHKASPDISANVFVTDSFECDGRDEATDRFREYSRYKF